MTFDDIAQHCEKYEYCDDSSGTANAACQHLDVAKDGYRRDESENDWNGSHQQASAQ